MLDFTAFFHFNNYNQINLLKMKRIFCRIFHKKYWIKKYDEYEPEHIIIEFECSKCKLMHIIKI